MSPAADLDTVSMIHPMINDTGTVAVLQAQECENLMRVVRELTASRSKLVAGKSVMAERFAELQQEYIKVLRIAELSRAASRSNLAKADRATNLAKQVRLWSQIQEPGFPVAPLDVWAAVGVHITEGSRLYRCLVQPWEVGRSSISANDPGHSPLEIFLLSSPRSVQLLTSICAAGVGCWSPSVQRTRLRERWHAPGGG